MLVVAQMLETLVDGRQEESVGPVERGAAMEALMAGEAVSKNLVGELSLSV